MSDTILTSEQVADDVRAGITPTNARVIAAQSRLLAHDAALRSRLAEVEAERDWYAALFEQETYTMEELAEAILEPGERIAPDYSTALAALAEAVELLRDLSESVPLGRHGHRARAFIEAHGSAPTSG